MGFYGSTTQQWSFSLFLFLFLSFSLFLSPFSLSLSLSSLFLSLSLSLSLFIAFSPSLSITLLSLHTWCSQANTVQLSHLAEYNQPNVFGLRRKTIIGALRAHVCKVHTFAELQGRERERERERERKQRREGEGEGRKGKRSDREQDSTSNYQKTDLHTNPAISEMLDFQENLKLLCETT